MGIRVSGGVATAPSARDYSGPADDDQFDDDMYEDVDDDLPPITTGFKAPPAKSNSTVYMKEFSAKFGKQLIRFMIDGDIGDYAYHWMGNFSAMCFDSAQRVSTGDFKSVKMPDGRCPVCKSLGVAVSRKTYYSIANFTMLGGLPSGLDVKDREKALAYESALPAFQILGLTQTAATQLEAVRETSSRTFTQLYFEVERTGTGPQTRWSFQSKKERDLEEDYPGIDLAAIHQFLDSGTPMTPHDVPRTSLTKLKEIAARGSV